MFESDFLIPYRDRLERSNTGSAISESEYNAGMSALTNHENEVTREYKRILADKVQELDLFTRDYLKGINNTEEVISALHLAVKHQRRRSCYLAAWNESDITNAYIDTIKRHLQSS